MTMPVVHRRVVGRPVSAPLAPPAGMLAWYKADAITGLTNGAAVASWPDSSGNGYTQTQSTTANQPVYTSNALNSKPGVTFGGGTQYFSDVNVTFAAPWTVCAALIPTNVANAFVRFFQTANTQTAGWNASTWWLSAQSGDNLSGGVPVNGTPYVTTYQAAGATSLIRANGVVQITGEAGSGASTTGFQLGNSARPLAATLCEVIIYALQLSGTAIGQAEAYLASRYGITI